MISFFDHCWCENKLAISKAQTKFTLSPFLPSNFDLSLKYIGLGRERLAAGSGDQMITHNYVGEGVQTMFLCDCFLSKVLRFWAISLNKLNLNMLKFSHKNLYVLI